MHIYVIEVCSQFYIIERIPPKVDMIAHSEHSLCRKQRKQQKSIYKQEAAGIQNSLAEKQPQYERSFPAPLLCVDLDQQGVNLYMSVNTKKQRRVYYNREGQKQKNVICDKFLGERIQSIIIEETFTIKSQLIGSCTGLDGNERKQTEDQKQQMKTLRYFDNQKETDDEDYDEKELIKCFHCKQLGHTARTCLQSIKVKCSYCLGDHHSSMCNNILCTFCHGPQHIGKQCEVRLKCFRCRKMGHVLRDCGQVLLNGLEGCSDRFDKHDMENVQCLKCGSMGHSNCHHYASSIPLIYTQTGS